jgi:GAF domain-containing protein
VPPILPSQSKTLLSPQELSGPSRLRAVRQHGFRNGSPRIDLRWVAGLTRRALSAETAVMTLLDDEREHCLAYDSHVPSIVPERAMPVTHSLCRFVVERNAPLVVHDAREHEVLSRHPAVTDFGVNTYAGVPVRAPCGEVLGSLCVVGAAPHHWTAQDLADLERLAQIVRHEMMLTIVPQPVVIRQSLRPPLTLAALPDDLLAASFWTD